MSIEKIAKGHAQKQQTKTEYLATERQMRPLTATLRAQTPFHGNFKNEADNLLHFLSTQRSKLMEYSEKNKETPEIDKTILEINDQRKREKEEKFVDLIIEIIVSATLREYYEKSDKIPTVQPTRTK